VSTGFLPAETATFGFCFGAARLNLLAAHGSEIVQHAFAFRPGIRAAQSNDSAKPASSASRPMKTVIVMASQRKPVYG
jgi:dienelactone hydrolase